MSFLDKMAKKTEEFQRAELAKVLAECKPEQRDFFNKIWEGRTPIPADKLADAHDLCIRTLVKNGWPNLHSGDMLQGGGRAVGA